MATVRMKKGNKLADIYDSPETIKQAQYDGYSLCEEKDSKQDSKGLVSESVETQDKKGSSRK